MRRRSSPARPERSRGQLRRMAGAGPRRGHHACAGRRPAAAPVRRCTTRARWPAAAARPARIVIGDPFSRLRAAAPDAIRAHASSPSSTTARPPWSSSPSWPRRTAGALAPAAAAGSPPVTLVFGPVSAAARRRLTPGAGRTVEVFTSMPVEPPRRRRRSRANRFAWTRARFGPPSSPDGADLVGTSLVETGVVDPRALPGGGRVPGPRPRRHPLLRPPPGERRQAPPLVAETGLEIVRPDLPLELIARRGPIGRTVLSFPSTVVHTLPLALWPGPR